VPTLEGTVSEMARSAIAAAHSDEERQAALRELGAWAGSEVLPGASVGSLLQSSLCAHAARVTVEDHPAIDEHSWLRRWWNEVSYLTFRDPLPLNVSYWFLFTDACAAPGKPLTAMRGGEVELDERWGSLGAQERQCVRAAGLACAFLEQRDLLLSGDFPVETTGHQAPDDRVGGRLCPLGWGSIFHSLRLPVTGSDVVMRHWYELLSGEPPEWKNSVAVLHRGTVWILNVPTDGTSYDAGSLYRALLGVVLRSGSVEMRGETGMGLGAATAQHRDAWADQFARIMFPAGPVSDAIDKIAKCAFVVCLDPRDPSQGHSVPSSDAATVQRASAMLLHSDAHSPDLSSHDRWYDKTLQIVVFSGEDSCAGLVAEHALVDGMPVAALSHAAAAREHHWIAHILETSSPTPLDAGVMVLPLPSPPSCAGVLSQAVAAGHEALLLLTSEHSCTAVSFSDYGSTVIKGCKNPPDAWVQMCWQLSWAIAHLGASPEGAYPPPPSTWGSTCPFPLAGQYEPAHARSFRGGRTACIRGLTSESRAWVQLCLEALERGRSPVTMQRALDALRDATARHRNLTVRALKALDVDRHWLGMRLIARRGAACPRDSALALSSPPVAPVSDVLTKEVSPAVHWPSRVGEAFHVLPTKQALSVAPLALASCNKVLGCDAVSRSQTWRISTSNLGSPYIANWGWGQVVPNGVGVAYSIAKDSVQVNVVGRLDSFTTLEAASQPPSAWTATIDAMREDFRRGASGRSLAEAFAWAVPRALRLMRQVASTEGARESRL
jgi:carnitine O-acetyltransferase